MEEQPHVEHPQQYQSESHPRVLRDAIDYTKPDERSKISHFHAMGIYANELQPRIAKANLTSDPLTRGSHSVPVADAIVTVDDSSEQWVFALVNRHPNQTRAFTVDFDGEPLKGSYAGLVLAGDLPEAFNDIEHPIRVVPQTGEFSKKVGLTAQSAEAGHSKHRSPRKRMSF